MPENPRPRGRSLYTAETGNAIVQWLSDGKTLREFCRQEGMPHWTTVYDWMAADAEFALRIARAREVGHDAIAEEALAIADTPQPGAITTVDKDGTSIRTEDMLGHRKLQIETRLKLLAKWNPKKYGDRTEHTINGPVSLELKGSDVDG